MHLLLPLIADLELLTKKFLLDMKEIATYLALISLHHGSIAYVIMIVGVMTTKIVTISLLFHQITQQNVRDSHCTLSKQYSLMVMTYLLLL